MTNFWKPIAERRKDYGSNFVWKQIDPADLTVEKNEIVAVVSTDKIDASGEIVLPKGMNLDRFRKQPAVYFDHNTDGIALGAAQWIKATNNQIISKYKISEDASPFHKAIATLVRDGAYRSHSVGFLSDNPKPPNPQELRFHPEWEGAKSIHRKSQLLEFSLVGMPCNDDAVALAIGKSFGQEVADRLLGKSQNTTEAIIDITNTVKLTELITPSDIRKEIMKEVEKVVKKIDKDKVLAEVKKSFGI